ncbi:methyltransferase domain-containing protein, partial [Cellulomonas hominis]|uniref:methyltransferase domain-containing protein n=1 Tax=Cellulomonas hominis TaxID=156981 RepID=UPI00144406AA|nr:class I SAM-dependent methyltransferase [Cellulomonas hominis]
MIPQDQARTRAGYDAVADRYAALLPDLRAESRLDVALLDELAARWSDGPGGPLLDVGCGTGRVAAHLAASGVDVLGADLSPGMVAAARRAHPGLPFLVAAADALPLPDACAGGVLAWYSVIHTAPAGLAAVVAVLVWASGTVGVPASAATIPGAVTAVSVVPDDPAPGQSVRLD